MTKTGKETTKIDIKNISELIAKVQDLVDQEKGSFACPEVELGAVDYCGFNDG